MDKKEVELAKIAKCVDSGAPHGNPADMPPPRQWADANTWLFADSVHPTTGGHKIVSDYVAAQLRSFGWI